MDTDGTITDIKSIGTALSDMTALEFGLLPNETVKSGDRLSDGAATIFGPIDYLKSGWPKETGGRLDPHQRGGGHSGRQ